MIRSKSDLRNFLDADAQRYSISLKCSNGVFEKIRRVVQYIIGIEGEEYQMLRYLRVLRHYEYYLNNSQKSLMCLLLCQIYSIIYKRLSKKYRIHLKPNVAGKGLYIPHFNGGIICNCIIMGDNCTITTGVVIGNKGEQKNRPTIGNNVELCVGCKVIGKIQIGDNVIVAPNSVCIKDIPENAIVSGVPSKIIKYRS